MSNLIDRNEIPAVDGGYTKGDVRDAYNDGYSIGIQRGYENAVLHYAKMALKQWIPCSERLPDKNGFYLCTTKDGETILEFNFGNPHYKDEPSFVSDFLGRCNPYVIAWMPLPEPYKEIKQ